MNNENCNTTFPPERSEQTELEIIQYVIFKIFF